MTERALTAKRFLTFPTDCRFVWLLSETQRSRPFHTLLREDKP